MEKQRVIELNFTSTVGINKGDDGALYTAISECRKLATLVRRKLGLVIVDDLVSDSPITVRLEVFPDSNVDELRTIYDLAYALAENEAYTDLSRTVRTWQRQIEEYYEKLAEASTGDLNPNPMVHATAFFRKLHDIGFMGYPATHINATSVNVDSNLRAGVVETETHLFCKRNKID